MLFNPYSSSRLFDYLDILRAIEHFSNVFSPLLKVNPITSSRAVIQLDRGIYPIVAIRTGTAVLLYATSLIPYTQCAHLKFPPISPHTLFNFSLGCGIGYGYLHRIPIQPAVPEKKIEIPAPPVASAVPESPENGYKEVGNDHLCTILIPGYRSSVHYSRPTHKDIQLRNKVFSTSCLCWPSSILSILIPFSSSCTHSLLCVVFRMLISWSHRTIQYESPPFGSTCSC